MPKLKYKNGSSWVELQLGGGQTLTAYPVGSFYISPLALYWAGGTDGATTYSYNLSTATSPAAIFGGTWSEIKISNVMNYGYPSEGFAIQSFLTFPTGSGPSNAGGSYYVLYTQNSMFKTTSDKISYTSIKTLIPHMAGTYPNYADGNPWLMARIWERTA